MDPVKPRPPPPPPPPKFNAAAAKKETTRQLDEAKQNAATLRSEEAAGQASSLSSQQRQSALLGKALGDDGIESLKVEANKITRASDVTDLQHVMLYDVRSSKQLTGAERQETSGQLVQQIANQAVERAEGPTSSPSGDLPQATNNLKVLSQQTGLVSPEQQAATDALVDHEIHAIRSLQMEKPDLMGRATSAEVPPPAPAPEPQQAAPPAPAPAAPNAGAPAPAPAAPNAAPPASAPAAPAAAPPAPAPAAPAPAPAPAAPNAAAPAPAPASPHTAPPAAVPAPPPRNEPATQAGAPQGPVGPLSSPPATRLGNMLQSAGPQSVVAPEAPAVPTPAAAGPTPAPAESGAAVPAPPSAPQGYVGPLNSPPPTPLGSMLKDAGPEGVLAPSAISPNGAPPAVTPAQPGKLPDVFAHLVTPAAAPVSTVVPGMPPAAALFAPGIAMAHSGQAGTDTGSNNPNAQQQSSTKGNFDAGAGQVVIKPGQSITGAATERLRAIYKAQGLGEPSKEDIAKYQGQTIAANKIGQQLTGKTTLKNKDLVHAGDLVNTPAVTIRNGRVV